MAGFFVVKKISAANQGDILINEIYYDPPGTDTGYEWIEFFNKTAFSIDVSHWEIQIAGTSFAAKFIFPSGTVIPGQSFFVVGESEVRGADLTSSTAIAMQNGGAETDGVRLVDDAGQIIDVVLYDSPNTNNLPDETGNAGVSFAPDVDAGHSLGRDAYHTDTNQSGDDFYDYAIPTMGINNEEPPDTIPPSAPQNLQAQAGNGLINFSWSANKEPDLDGYRLYLGTSSGNYSQNIDVGKVTTYMQSSLINGQTYYAALSAYDENDNESSLSSEVFATPFAPSVYNFHDVVINEIMWDEGEYIELYNSTANPINLSAWTLIDNNGIFVTFGDEHVISAHSYFLIEDSPSTTTVAEDLVASMTLNNTGEQITLKDNTGKIIDQANQASGGWFAGKNTSQGEAMERKSAASDGTIKESWHTSIGNIGGRVGTPKVANSAGKINHAPEVFAGEDKTANVGEKIDFDGSLSLDSDGDSLEFFWDFGDGKSAEGSKVEHSYDAAGTYTVILTVSDGELQSEDTLRVTIIQPIYSRDIVINEFLPNPEGSDSAEFIEIKNLSASKVNLGGWKLDDEEGGSKPYVFPVSLIIEGRGFLVVYRKDSNIALNNNGDRVRLFHPDNNLIYDIAYNETAPEGASYNWTPSGWQWSTTLTPGAENIITKAEEEDEKEKTGAKNAAKSKTAKKTSVQKKETAKKTAIKGASSTVPKTKTHLRRSKGSSSASKKAPSWWPTYSAIMGLSGLGIWQYLLNRLKFKNFDF